MVIIPTPAKANARYRGRAPLYHLKFGGKASKQHSFSAKPKNSGAFLCMISLFLGGQKEAASRITAQRAQL